MSFEADILSAIERSRQDQRSTILTISIPLSPDSYVPQGDFYWYQNQQILVANGRELVITADANQERFSQIKKEIKFWLENATGNPYFIGGFAFYDQPSPSYPPALFFLPQWLWQKDHTSIIWAVNLIIQPDSQLDEVKAVIEARYQNLKQRLLAPNSQLPAVQSISELTGQFSWAIAVEKALQLIHQGQLEKLVLARVLEIITARAIDTAQVLENLSQNYPNCTVFGINLTPNAYLVGASPEHLLRSQFHAHHLLIETLALAGSIPRGASPTQDQVLGQQLLTSTKDLQEHQIVINSICQTLTKLQANILPIPEPQLMSLANVQHLCTPIKANILTDDPLTIFDAIAELHPTAAMAGSPKEIALPLMQKYEPSDRGWYASPLGWLDSQGNSEFVVSIRCALITGNHAKLFAGSGIIASSDIDQEITETNAKFTPMLNALGLQAFP